MRPFLWITKADFNFKDQWRIQRRSAGFVWCRLAALPGVAAHHGITGPRRWCGFRLSCCVGVAPTTVSLSLSLPFSFHPRDEVDRKRTAGSCGICKESLRKEVTVQMSGSQCRTQCQRERRLLYHHTSDSLCYSNRNQPQSHYFSLMDESAAQNIRMNLLFHFHSKSSLSSANLEA